MWARHHGGRSWIFTSAQRVAYSTYLLGFWRDNWGKTEQYLLGIHQCISFVSGDIASVKQVYAVRSQRSTVKRQPLSNSSLFLHGTKLFLNASIAVILIQLSGDVESNPGPKFEIKKCLTRGLKVSHLNIRSLLPKIDSLRLFIDKNPFDIVALSETWLKTSINNAEISIPNYSITRQDRQDKSGGGTTIYVRDGLPYRTRTDLTTTNMETCWIEITRTKTKPLFICSVYKPPNSRVDNFIDELDKSLTKLPENAEIVLLGDFNVDYQSRRSVDGSRLHTFARANSFEQIIASPTRITEKTQSTIGLIFLNNSCRVTASGVVSLSLSDHSLIFCVLKAGIPKSSGNHRNINYRSYKNYDKRQFNEDLEKLNWSFVDDPCQI